MVTQGERQNFLWRPNDTSVTTRTRYDLEADHWLKSFGSSIKVGASKGASFMEVMGYFGLFISFFITLLLFIVLCIIEILKFIRKVFIFLFPVRVEDKSPVMDEPLTEDEFIRLYNAMDDDQEAIDIRNFDGNC